MTGKIVDAQKKDHSGRAIGKSHDAAQKRLASRLYSQPSGEPGTAFAAGRQPNGGDLLAVPDRHPGAIRSTKAGRRSVNILRSQSGLRQ